MGGRRTDRAELERELERLRERVRELEESRPPGSSSAAGRRLSVTAICRSVIESLPDTSAIAFDHDLRFVFAAGPAFARHGYDVPSMEGKTLTEILAPEDDDAREVTPYYRAALSGSPGVFQKEYDGRTYRTHFVPLRDADGGVIAAAAVSYDMTDSLTLEQTLQDQVELFRAITENARDSIFCKSSDRRYTFVNPAMTEVLGLPADRIVGKTPDEIFDPDSARTIEEVDRRAFAGEVMNSVRTLNVGDDPRTFHTIQVPIPNEEGEINSICGFVRDVTDERRAEDALRESEQRLRFAVDAIRGVIWSIDRELVFTMSRGFGLVDLGLEPDQVVGNTLREYLGTGPEADLAIRMHHRALAGEDVQYETRAGDLTFDSRLEPLKDEDGSVVGVLGVAYDVTRHKKAEDVAVSAREDLEKRVLERTAELHQANEALLREVRERKDAEDALRAAEEKYRTLVENLPDFVLTVDREYIVQYVNKPNERFGHESNELVGRHLGDFADARSSEALVAACDVVFELGQAQHVETGDRMGEIYTVEIVPVRRDGLVDQVMLIASVVTDRRKAEEALRESEGFLNTVVENLPNMVFVKEADDLRFVRFNRAGENLLGYSRDDLIGKNDYDFFPKEEADFFVAKDREVLEQGVLLDIPEEPIMTRERGLRFLHTKKIPIRDDDGRPRFLLGISEDITERKKAEEERTRLEEQLRQAQKMQAIGQLAGGVAHDFNNILMGVVGGASLIKRRLSPDDAIYEKVIAIERSAERAVLLTNQLLAFARGGKYQPVVIDLAHSVSDAVGFLPSSLKQQVRIETRFADDVPDVEADPTQLVQVVTNLCSNAGEAMDGRGEVTIEVRRARPDELPSRFSKEAETWVLLSVSDTGPGVAPGDRERVFDPFYTSKDFGRGLGLAAVWGIVHNHHGTITCDEAPSGGARFSVFLPAYAGDSEESTPIADAEFSVKRGRDFRILVVDDESISRDMTTSLLESIGFQTLAAGDGPTALDVLEKNAGRIDLVMLDAVMPDMDGWETYRRIRATDTEIHVLFMSGFSREMVFAGRTDDQDVRFIRKPFDAPSLSAAIREIITPN